MPQDGKSIQFSLVGVCVCVCDCSSVGIHMYVYIRVPSGVYTAAGATSPLFLHVFSSRNITSRFLFITKQAENGHVQSFLVCGITAQLAGLQEQVHPTPYTVVMESLWRTIDILTPYVGVCGGTPHPSHASTDAWGRSPHLDEEGKTTSFSRLLQV